MKANSPFIRNGCWIRGVAVGCLLVAGTSAAVIAQSSVVATPAVPSDLTIVQVVQDAEQNYPAIHISEQDLNAAVANIRLARTAYLPRLDGIVQVNRATRNNVFGTLFPQNTLPSMSGPVIGTNNAEVNAPILSINARVGFKVAWRNVDYQVTRASLDSWAGRRAGVTNKEANQRC